jgi:hypothetical protein
LCSQLKVIAAADSVAEYNLIGIDTIPKDTVADPMARAAMNLSVSIGRRCPPSRRLVGVEAA